MSSLVGKYFKPKIGAVYRRMPAFGEAHHAGEFTIEAQKKAPHGFEVVAIESGHALCRLPTGSMRYMMLDAGDVVDAPPPPRIPPPFVRELLSKQALTDPEGAAAQARAEGFDWEPPPVLDFTGVPALRQLSFKMLQLQDPNLAREHFDAWRKSPEGIAEITAEVAKLAAQHAPPQAPTLTPDQEKLRATLDVGR